MNYLTSVAFESDQFETELEDLFEKQLFTFFKEFPKLAKVKLMLKSTSHIIRLT